MKHPLLTVVLCLATCNVFAQGQLNPSTGPAMSMKSLDQIEPRIAISSLPYSINAGGSYYVTTNLNSASSGLTISTNNVTVDLGGFSLNGTASSGGIGVYLFGAVTNVVVRHGSVVNWHSYGVYAASSTNNLNITFEDLQIAGNKLAGLQASGQNCLALHCLVSSNASVGIFFNQGTLTSCQASGNLGTGISVIRTLVRDCISSANTGYGFLLYDSKMTGSGAYQNSSSGISIVASEIEGCEVGYGASTGIDLFTGSVRNSQIHNNANVGIYVQNGLVSGCNIRSNLVHGISCSGQGSVLSGNLLYANNQGGLAGYAGIYLQGSNNRVEDNHVVAGGTNTSLGNGISSQASYTNNIVIKNTVIGFGVRNYLIATGNDLGPVGGATNSTSPWANISH